MAERVREKRNLPHPKKRGMAFFRFYFFNILIGLVIVVATVVLLSVTIFQITKVSVKGNAVLSDDEISALVITGKYPKNGLYEWFINTVHPKTDIPFVDTYTMSFKKPSNIVINVHEVNMIGYIPMVDGTYAYFDGDGKVVEISERLVAGYLPVSGITCDGAKVGKTLPINKRCLNVLLQVTKSLKKYDVSADAVAFQDDREVAVQSGPLVLNFGTFRYLDEKIMRLQYILPTINGQAGILHLENWTPESTDIVFEASE